MIAVDPNDKELNDAIEYTRYMKRKWDEADKAWDRKEPSMYVYTRGYDAWNKAKQAYEGSLINLALIFMERVLK